MKWNENDFVRKTMSVVGYVCIVVALILCFLEACDIQPIPETVTCALISVFFLCAGLKADKKKENFGICSCCRLVCPFFDVLLLGHRNMAKDRFACFYKCGLSEMPHLGSLSV